MLQHKTVVVCNVLALSRGGIGGIFLAQALAKHKSPKRIELNMLLFDPVPGDQVFSGFPYTGMYARDVSDCTCLRRVLALYPHEPLPEIAFHAPVLCAYPETCMVEEDVTLGCHQGALFSTRRSENSTHVASNLSFKRISDFLSNVGSIFELGHYFNYQPSDADCLAMCRNALTQQLSTRRPLHDGLGKCALSIKMVNRPRAGDRAAALGDVSEPAPRNAGTRGRGI